MTIGYFTVTLITVGLNLFAAIADFARAGFVLANGARLRIPESWLPALAVPKAAGAAGLLLGLAGIPVIGMAAAVGLVLFFVGAVIVHLRAGEHRMMAIPSAFLAAAIATLTLIVINEPGW